MLELFKTRLRTAICARLNCQGYPHVHIFIWTIRLSCTAKWFLMSFAEETSIVIKEDSLFLQLFEGKGRIVLHHKPNQEQLDDSTEGLRRSGRTLWFIIYEQDRLYLYTYNFLVLRIFLLKSRSSNVDHIGKSF